MIIGLLLYTINNLFIHIPINTPKKPEAIPDTDGFYLFYSVTFIP
jgi:hypothetical protein